MTRASMSGQTACGSTASEDGVVSPAFLKGTARRRKSATRMIFVGSIQFKVLVG